MRTMAIITLYIWSHESMDRFIFNKWNEFFKETVPYLTLKKQQGTNMVVTLNMKLSLLRIEYLVVKATAETG